MNDNLGLEDSCEAATTPKPISGQLHVSLAEKPPMRSSVHLSDNFRLARHPERDRAKCLRPRHAPSSGRAVRADVCTRARTPVLRRPSDIGLDFEEAFFPSLDGIPLEAWFIPADSDKLLIVNHPMTCNRYGFPGHLPPWNTMFGGFEVNFLPELKHLHDAGYNILTYDLRDPGLSGEANGVISGLGLLECRDVVGSIRYAKSQKSQKNLKAMKTGLYSKCMGGNSTIIAMAKWPEEFSHIQALVLLNVVSGKTFIERGAENLHLDPAKAAARLDERVRELTGFRLDD